MGGRNARPLFYILLFDISIILHIFCCIFIVLGNRERGMENRTEWLQKTAIETVAESRFH